MPSHFAGVADAAVKVQLELPHFACVKLQLPPLTLQPVFVGLMPHGSPAVPLFLLPSCVPVQVAATTEQADVAIMVLFGALNRHVAAVDLPGGCGVRV